MICPKCGKECNEGKYCSQCGALLTKTCRKCHRELSENDIYCPSCGTKYAEKVKNCKCDNLSTNETISLIGFLLTVIFSAINMVKVLTINVSLRLVINSFRFYFPRPSLIIAYALLFAAVIVFACVYRKTKLKGFGITAIVFAALSCVFGIRSLLGFSFFNVYTQFLALAGTVMCFCTTKHEAVKKTPKCKKQEEAESVTAESSAEETKETEEPSEEQETEKK